MKTDTDTLSYRSDPALKAGLVAEAQDHRAQDRLIRGAYLEPDGGIDWRGCAVGCTIAGRLSAEEIRALAEHPGNWHVTWADVTGLPEWLAHLEDTIFESLPIEDAQQWPVRLLSAVPVGVDLTPIREPWLREVVFDPQFGAFASAARALESAGLGAEAARLRGLPVTTDWEAAGDAASAARGAAWAADDAASAAQWQWLAGSLIRHLESAGSAVAA